jgi:DNA-binding NarL/FixJ family response regulator
MSRYGVRARRRIVIADDQGLVRAALQALLLGEPSLEVVGEAQDGREAIERVHETAPDLVLMDIAMPGMNGIDATAEIRRRHKNIGILVLSVHSNEAYVQAAIFSGANGYIVKDASREQFLEAIHDVLQRDRLRPLQK